MRLPSIIVVFAAFALLSSASPINDYNRRSNSLWRRIGHVKHKDRGHVRGGSSNHIKGPLDHTHPDGTFIQDDPNGSSFVRLRHARSGCLYSHVSGGPNERHSGCTFYEAGFDGLRLRNYQSNEQDFLTYLECNDGKWMTFYPTSAPSPRQQNGPDGRQIINYTTTKEDSDGTYVQRFFRPRLSPNEQDPHELLSLKRNRHGEWTTSGELTNIEWLAPPQPLRDDNDESSAV